MIHTKTHMRLFKIKYASITFVWNVMESKHSIKEKNMRYNSRNAVKTRFWRVKMRFWSLKTDTNSRFFNHIFLNRYYKVWFYIVKVWSRDSWQNRWYKVTVSKKIVTIPLDHYISKPLNSRPLKLPVRLFKTSFRLWHIYQCLFLCAYKIQPALKLPKQKLHTLCRTGAAKQAGHALISNTATLSFLKNIQINISRLIIVWHIP